MKLHLFIVILLIHFMWTVQEKKEELTNTEEDLLLIEEDFLKNFSNFTFSYIDSAPCSISIPGFNSLGLMIIYLIVFVVSMIGNGVVIFVVCSMKKRRASTDVYLMHLAIADLLFCLTLPFWATESHFGWIYGNFLCKLLSGLQESSVYGGVFLLACISVDRYFAIVRATRVLSSHRHLVRVVCSVVWLVASVLSLPVAIKRESMYAEELDENICYENLTGESRDQWRVSMRVLRHTLGFFLPLTVMAICYSCTVVKLFHSRNQQKHKAMRVILAVVLAFIFCWLPHNITVLTDTLIKGGSLKLEECENLYRVELMLKVTKVLAYMHCAVNPVLYAFIGEKFRNQLLLALYKHGLISKRIQVAYRTDYASSNGSIRSRNTSVTL